LTPGSGVRTHMAFGFGFNKQKVLNAAEKYVQQGKMQNAIAEYEKVLKADPKDLTVTNTVGDLYSRLGQVDKATECFKLVGDAYANQGFTVKAIAMYKKISKLKPSLGGVLKLAELYTQQGLFNDARSQYLQVAEEFLKSGELDNAVRIFQKILEMDPENTSMRLRLAEVYIRLGKKDDAWQIFSAAADTLRAKGNLSGAEEVLQRMLTLDPGNSYALLIQGRNQLEAGDAEAAIESFQKVHNLDSNLEGLRSLLKAYLKMGRLSDAGTLASKLQAVHNDLSAISTLADALMQAGQFENALQVYDQHADRLLSDDSAKVLKNLHAVIGHVRDNPASLEKILDIFQKAGDTTHVSEVTELLAHASVQSADLPRARDLYQKLADMEPGNPLHMDNYQQVVSQLGGASSSTAISADEAAVMIEELEATAPSIHQHYSDAVALAVRSALTDAELFISYNMPAKALGPLMAAMPQAPHDLRLNQRLAALHTRAARFAEAATCCRTLQNIYSEAGHPEEATRYGQLADRYEERSSPSIAKSVIESAAMQTDASMAPTSAAHASAPWPTAAPRASEETEFAVVAGHDYQGDDLENNHRTDDQSATVSESVVPAEIDLSSEWDDAVTIEADPSPAETAAAEVTDAVGDHIPAAQQVPDKTAEAIEEFRFFLEHGMPEQASAAFAKIQSLTSDEGVLRALRAEIAAASATAATDAAAIEAVPEFSIDEPAAKLTVDEIPAAAEEAPVVIETPAVEEIVASEIPAPPVPAAVEPAVAKIPAVPSAGVLQEFVSDLESSLGDSFLPGAVPHAPEAVVEHAAAFTQPAQHAPIELEPIGHAAPTTFGVPQAEPMGEFVADLEESLGEDFLKDAPLPEPQSPAPAQPAAFSQSAAQIETPVTAISEKHLPVPAAVSAPIVTNAAAAGASSGIPAVTHRPAVPTAPAATKPVAPASSAAAKSSPFTEDAGVDLAEMFGELKQDLEAGAATTEEDPETHYNLGIAFREMGLLDEAIGELQKTCQAVDRGHPFPQVMQTYTWLAQCFLDKAMPEAAIRWYQKALDTPSIDGETYIALHYELASAHEAAGDRPAALKHFMEVYGRNIDYRDVAERIKPLKS
jgi:tetratricopeptide (TPR) repeat protein